MFVADGYNGTRIVKFDRNGKFLMAWGQKGIEPNDKRPGHFNVVHGIAADPVTRRIYVADRGNTRVQVFDENGKFIDQWPFLDGIRSSVNFAYIGADRALWVFDDPTSKIVKYDLEGHYLYSWGALGDFPGGLFNIHGASVDQEGNLYVAEAGFYRRHNEPAIQDRDVDLRDEIQKIALEFPCYGRRRIAAELKRRGWKVNPSTCQWTKVNINRTSSVTGLKKLECIIKRCTNGRRGRVNDKAKMHTRAPRNCSNSN